MAALGSTDAGPVVVVSSARPHFAQNFACGALAVPHVWQALCGTGAPQVPQNLAFLAIGLPHCAQRAAPGPSSRPLENTPVVMSSFSGIGHAKPNHASCGGYAHALPPDSRHQLFLLAIDRTSFEMTTRIPSNSSTKPITQSAATATNRAAMGFQISPPIADCAEYFSWPSDMTPW